MTDTKLKTIVQELQNTKALEACANDFGVVGDETRLKICYLLCRHPQLSVGQIAKLTGVTVSAASHSLKKLKSIGVVDRRRQAQNIFYSLSDQPITKLITGYLRTNLHEPFHQIKTSRR